MSKMEIIRSKTGVQLAACLGMLLWLDTASAAEAREPQVESGDAEEIEVTGRRTLLSVKAEIIDLENRMFRLFNQLNDERQFDIICSEEIVTASRIPERECSPIYMRRARMTAAQQFVFFDLTPPNFDPSRGPPRNGPSKSLNTRGAPMSDEQLWFQNEAKHVEFNDKFRELAASNPELNNVALDWKDKQQLLVEMEEERRENSLLGRLFGKRKKAGE